MATDLSKFRAAVIAAAKVAVSEMQLQMAMESTNAIDSFMWTWKGRIPDTRPITDSGELNRSMELTPIDLNANRISFSLKWDPVDVENFPQVSHYADIVHDGRKEWFRMEDGTMRDYTARPWTFLLMPPEQRNASRLKVSSGPSAESLPDDAWEACLTAFNLTLKNQLANSFKVI